MSYENYLIREMTECAPGDTNCSDCNQVICACESLADWHRERELAEPTSFSQWLDQTGDSI
jgi:hypothetical protein